VKSVYDLSWKEDSFRAKRELFFRSRREKLGIIRESTDRMVQARAYSSLSSVYYSIAGTALSRLKEIIRHRHIGSAFLYPVSWALLGCWCYYRMLPLSNRVLETCRGYGQMSADMCDVRQSILRKRGRFSEALVCINWGLQKHGSKPHTLGLLLIGKADIYSRKGEKAGAYFSVKEACNRAIDAEKDDPNQAIRIYRNVAAILDLIKMDPELSRLCRQKTAELAEATGAKDQLLKM